MIITSKIFEGYPEIIHGVSTKQTAGGEAVDASTLSNNMSRHVGDDLTRVMQNREVFYSALGIETAAAKFAHANQVHSGNITVVDEGGIHPKTDALITNKKNLFLVISIADCLPVILYDPVHKAIGNIHSGWRGTVTGIAENTISKMKDEFGSNPGDILAFIGPGISCENFEVGAEVAEMFDEKYVHVPPRLALQGEPPLLKTGGEQKRYIDLKSVVRDQLLNAGVLEKNIDTCPLCTFTENDMLHSYRRDRDMSGRMFSVIGMK